MTDNEYVARVKDEQPMEPEAVSTPGIPVRYAPLPDGPIEQAQRVLDRAGIPRLPTDVLQALIDASQRPPTPMIMGIPVEVSNALPEGAMYFRDAQASRATFRTLNDQEIAAMKNALHTTKPLVANEVPSYRSPLLDALYDVALSSKGLRWRLQQEGASHALLTCDRTGATQPHFELRLTMKAAWQYSRGQWREMIEDMLEGLPTDVTPFILKRG